MNQIDSQLDLNLFRVLDALYTHGGTSSAARALHLTQSAVSHALGRLRESLDDPLFVRQGNRMVPTERTRRIMPEIQAHLRGLYAALSSKEQFRPEKLNQEFKVAFRDALESIVFPELTARLAHEAPGVTLFSRYVPLAMFESELSTGKLDLAIDREVKTSDKICSVKMISEPWAVVTRRSRDRLSLHEYIAAKHVLVTQLDGVEPIDDFLSLQGLRRAVAMRCQHYLAACRVVMATEWMLSMPKTYAEQLAQILPLNVLPLPFEMPPIDVFMYWHNVHDSAPEHIWLRRVLIEAAADGSGLRAAARKGDPALSLTAKAT
jgi:DNA-binding transcriptional LysR family regulator